MKEARLSRRLMARGFEENTAFRSIIRKKKRSFVHKAPKRTREQQRNYLGIYYPIVPSLFSSTIHLHRSRAA